MADDDQNRAREAEAEREAEINSEMERVDQDPDQVDDGSESLGTESAESGTPRDGEDDAESPLDEPDSDETADDGA